MKIGDILKDTLPKKQFGKKIYEAMLFVNYPKLVGEEVAKISKPLHLTRGVMFIGVESPVWSHHLHFLKPDIMRKLNSSVGRNLVRDIKFKITRLDQDYNVSDIVPRKRVKKPLPQDKIKRIENIGKQIDDEELRKGFIKLMREDAKFQLNKGEGELG